MGSRKRLGIVGFGAFGRFMAEHLAPGFEVVVHDRLPLAEEAQRRGVRWGTLGEIAAQEIVIPAVPVQELEGVLAQLAPLVRPGSLVIDVASVKVKPMALHERYLPGGVEYLGLHPMFGPQSGRHGIAGLKVVLCPGRSARAAAVRRFLEEELELQVYEMSPEEHDREMAYIQGLTHWMAMALREIHAPDLELATIAYRHLMQIEENLRDDSWELFVTIADQNPFAADARRELLDRLREIEERLESHEH